MQSNKLISVIDLLFSKCGIFIYHLFYYQKILSLHHPTDANLNIYQKLFFFQLWQIQLFPWWWAIAIFDMFLWTLPTNLFHILAEFSMPVAKSCNKMLIICFELTAALAGLWELFSAICLKQYEGTLGQPWQISPIHTTNIYNFSLTKHYLAVIFILSVLVHTLLSYYYLHLWELAGNMNPEWGYGTLRSTEWSVLWINISI